MTELDGERLLTWSPVGTPFTDLLVARLAAAGARVQPVQARVSGAAASLTDLQRLGAVAVAAPNSLKHERTVELAFADGIALPLLVLWRAGVPSSAVDRVRAAMSGGVDEPQ